MSVEGELDLNEIHNFAVQITRECDDIFREGFSGVKLISTKSEMDFVIDYDYRIENYLKTRILEAYPSRIFLGEETSSLDNVAAELTDRPTWVIDPIDGTGSFIKQNPFCAVSVAFVYQREVVVGVISNPIRNEVFTALKGNGSFLNGTGISTSEMGRNKSDAEILESTRSVIPGLLPGVLRAYIENGSLIAFYAEYLKPWDTAAGILIVPEAGDVVHAHDGSELDIMKPKLIAATDE